MAEMLIPTCLMAFGLGARHAFDPDHITIIDGCARRNVRARPVAAYLSGVLFSAGHGTVVAAAAAIAAGIGGGLRLPAWLETSGWAISVGVLLLLGSLNLHAALTAPQGRIIALVGWKARLGGNRGDSPLAVFCIGMLLALSFDTLAQASMLGIASGRLPVVGGAVLLVLAYVGGLVSAGGFNGVAIAWLARSATRRAATASRVMAAVIGCINLAVGAIVLATALSPAIAEWAETRALAITAAIIAIGAAGYLAALLVPADRPRFGRRADIHR